MQGESLKISQHVTHAVDWYGVAKLRTVLFEKPSAAKSLKLVNVRYHASLSFVTWNKSDCTSAAPSVAIQIKSCDTRSFIRE